MTNLSLWILLFPLLGFIILGLLGRFMSRTSGSDGGLGCLRPRVPVCRCSILLVCWAHPPHLASAMRWSIHWMVSGSRLLLTINFGQLLDPLSMTMLLVVTGVGFLIHIYSAGYMEDDPGFWRFFAYLNFFIFAMVLLVTADNFLFLLVGWGLVGLASFLLIGFWYQRPRRSPLRKKRL